MASRGLTLLLSLMALVLLRATTQDIDEDIYDCLDEDKNICSNKGNCVDGVCQCRSGFVFGKFCQSTLRGRCQDIKACVQCMAFNSGPIDHWRCNEICLTNTDFAAFSIVKELSDDDNLCAYRDTDGCEFRFSYALSTYVEDKLQINVYRQKFCPRGRF